MRKILLSLMSVALVLVVGANAKDKKVAKDFRAVSPATAQIEQSGKAKMFCPVCGMTLPSFYRTNHTAVVNGKVHQYCSIHCMIEEAMLKGTKVVKPRAVDNSTMKFIDANKAFYVVGSKKPSTMSMVSKYAFGTEKAALDFSKKFGGKIMSYAQVSKIVRKNLKKEIMGIKKKQAKMAMMGKKIYNKMCKKTDIRFATPALAKVYIQENNLCGKIKGKPFQAVALYLAGKGEN
ncbi:nitrous oxide reductase accessory protein NosL [Sulfurospirillum sp. 1612]|uniref:nitrous oxide reductase accessory protein NosL n=1 Tax=Sulfurospirillum sp. 1612 TaxID=3094835 RepID=UPI002F95E212